MWAASDNWTSPAPVDTPSRCPLCQPSCPLVQLSCWRFCLNSYQIGGVRAVKPRYSEERKAAVLKKLLPPQNRSVVQVAAEEHVSDVTLYSWLKQCRQQGVPVPGCRNAGDDGSPDAKLAVVIETASMSEPELSAYCRQKGLYPEQVQRWKEACLHGFGLQEGQEKAAQKQ
jgi:hypothetical protein